MYIYIYISIYIYIYIYDISIYVPTYTNLVEIRCWRLNTWVHKGSKCFLMYRIGNAKFATAVATCTVVRTKVPRAWTTGYKKRAGCVLVDQLVASSGVDTALVRFSTGGYCMNKKLQDFSSLKGAIQAAAKGKDVFICASILKERAEELDVAACYDHEGDHSSSNSDDIDV